MSMQTTTANGAAPEASPNAELAARLRGDAEHLRHQARQALARGEAENKRLLRLADSYEALADREASEPTRLPASVPQPPAPPALSAPSGHLPGTPVAGELPIGAAAADSVEGGAPWRR